MVMNVAPGTGDPRVLVEMFRNVQRKARQEIPPPPVLPSAITMLMDGIGQPLTVGHAGSIPVPFPCRILGCQMRTGVFNSTSGPVPVVATAVVELRLGQQSLWATGTRPLYANLPPTMTAVAEATPSITGWVTELQPTDVLAFALTSFSGAATFLELSLIVRRLDARGVGTDQVIEGDGDTLVDSAGNRVVSRG